MSHILIQIPELSFMISSSGKQTYEDATKYIKQQYESLNKEGEQKSY